MNIAMVGSSGYIASYLTKHFSRDPSVSRILRIDRAGDADVYLDLREADKFDYGVLDGVDHVVFTAAVSGPDRCAADYETCWSINVEGTKHFIRMAMRYGCRVLFFSSDAVFGDIPGAVYTEESETMAVTAYGRMKKAVEDEFKADTLFRAIRLSYVVSAGDRFVTYCLDCIRKEKTAEIFHPFYRNCIVAGDVVKVVAWFSKHFDEYAPFVLNVAGSELVSRIRIADEINRVTGGKLDYRLSVPEDGFFANRPGITQMRSLYLEPYGILENRSFSEKIRTELEVLKW